MRKLSWREVVDLNKEYSWVINDIHVIDFESAIERCKQKLCENFRKHEAELSYKDRLFNTKTINREIKYRNDVYTGKRYIPSAESMKQFCGVINSKYGSLRNYWDKKQRGGK